MEEFRRISRYQVAGQVVGTAMVPATEPTEPTEPTKPFVMLLSCCSCRCYGRFASYLYIFFVGWQFMNLPMYAGLMVLPATNVTNATTDGNSFGMELAPMANFLWGQRGLKIFVDPYLFLGPHSIMGTLRVH